MIFRAVTFDKVDAVASAKKPDAKRNHRINSVLERHGNDWRAEFARFGENLAGRVANEPGAMAVGVEPIDFKTSAILLSAPTAATLKMK